MGKRAFKPSNMESMHGALQQQRLEVEQLRREAAMKRIPVSQAVEDIKAYIREHGQEDCLLTGFHGKNSNPFREKSSCEVLWIGSSFIYKSWQPHFSMFFHLYSA